MKLGELKSLIRHRKGNPSVSVTFAPGRNVVVTVQKASILEALDAAFSERNGETGLILNDDGLLISEGASLPADDASEPEANSDELDDLDALDEIDDLDDLDDLDEL